MAIPVGLTDVIYKSCVSFLVIRSTLFVATGMWKPIAPLMEGEEFIEDYETVNIDPETFEGQSVLILGYFYFYGFV